jgi:hypothetical protein
MPIDEHCRNPWNGKCRNRDIEVYILYKGERLPICRSCWAKIAESEIQWSQSESERRMD